MESQGVGCSSGGRVFMWSASNPGFHPWNSVNWVWFCRLLVLHLGMGTGLPEVQAHPRQLSKFKGYTRSCLKEKHIDKIMWRLSFDPHCYFNSIYF